MKKHLSCIVTDCCFDEVLKRPVTAKTLYLYTKNNKTIINETNKNKPMKKQLLQLAIGLITLTTIVTSCKKSEDDAVTPATPVE